MSSLDPRPTGLMQARRVRRKGQAVVAAVIIISVVLVAVPAAIEAVGLSTVNISQTGNWQLQASQTAMSGLDDYVSRLNSSSSYGTSYCSQFQSWTCNHTIDPDNPAFSDRFDPNCSTSSSTSSSDPSPDVSPGAYGWVTTVGTTSTPDQQYQYVVNTSNLAASNLIYIYVNGRYGKSGSYTCSSIKAAISLLNGVATVLVVRPQAVSSTTW